MKKVLSLVLLCAMVLTLAACGNTKTETPDPPQQSETIQDDQATILPAPGELTKPAPAPETETEAPAPEQGVVTGPRCLCPSFPSPHLRPRCLLSRLLPWSPKRPPRPLPSLRFPLRPLPSLKCLPRLPQNLKFLLNPRFLPKIPQSPPSPARI